MNCRRTLYNCVSSLSHSSELFVAPFSCVRQTPFPSEVHFDIAVLARKCFITFYPSIHFSIFSRELFEEIFRLLLAYIELIRKRSRPSPVHRRKNARFHHIAVD